MTFQHLRFKVFDSNAKDLFDCHDEANPSLLNVGKNIAKALPQEVHDIPKKDTSAVTEKTNQSNKFKTFDLNFEELFSDELNTANTPIKEHNPNFVVNDTFQSATSMNASKASNTTSDQINNPNAEFAKPGESHANTNSTSTPMRSILKKASGSDLRRVILLKGGSPLSKQYSSPSTMHSQIGISQALNILVDPQKETNRYVWKKVIKENFRFLTIFSRFFCWSCFSVYI